MQRTTQRKHGIYEVKDGPNGTFMVWKQGRPIRPFGRNELLVACRYAQLQHESDTLHEERLKERQENLRHIQRGEPWKIRHWR